MGNHVMVDIETLGTTARAPMLSLGACTFDPMGSGVGSTFKMIFDPDDVIRRGMNAVSWSTVRWWMGQSSEAQGALPSMSGDTPLVDGLKAFSEWMPETLDIEGVWAQGSHFDMAILGEAYYLCGLSAPWNFWTVRDTRTLAEAARILGIVSSKTTKGVAHDPLDDAISQAHWVQELTHAIVAARGASA